jgi:riboflavin biosynthesis pyrimidine reductase
MNADRYLRTVAGQQRAWIVRQGRSSGTVRASDYAAARERAAQIGFRNPDAIVLDESADAESSARLQCERLAEWREDERDA